MKIIKISVPFNSGRRIIYSFHYKPFEQCSNIDNCHLNTMHDFIMLYAGRPKFNINNYVDVPFISLVSFFLIMLCHNCKWISYIF